jgi:hypothetical protein
MQVCSLFYLTVEIYGQFSIKIQGKRMSSTAPQQLIISGVVLDSINSFASIGDVRLHPGANRTGYIDGYIFDGRQWRSLDLKSFGSISRSFGSPGEVGPIMRKIASKVAECKAMPVYYELTNSGKKSRYVFRGVPMSTFLASWNRL